mmetsp:Transcript_17728/g.58253  ORF Transcript_17728/g.58253 Transcript_17728/m.58253 type:complete len:194 (-) Transcript_17728:2731-3312(-)
MADEEEKEHVDKPEDHVKGKPLNDDQKERLSKLLRRKAKLEAKGKELPEKAAFAIERLLLKPGACAFADEVEETIDEEDDEPKALNDKQKERLEKLLKHKAKLEAHGKELKEKGAACLAKLMKKPGAAELAAELEDELDDIKSPPINDKQTERLKRLLKADGDGKLDDKPKKKAALEKLMKLPGANEVASASA